VLGGQPLGIGGGVGAGHAVGEGDQELAVDGVRRGRVEDEVLLAGGVRPRRQ
jgi:hypothetical protein